MKKMRISCEVKFPKNSQPFCNFRFDSDVKVADFIDKDRHVWDDFQLKDCFSDSNRDVILYIPLSCKERPNGLLWHYEKKGDYTVRSGYRLALSGKSRGEGSNPTQVQK
ncbi:hypothetical protein ACOSQ2_025333 [Xanthoceras sorbifolium]